MRRQCGKDGAKSHLRFRLALDSGFEGVAVAAGDAVAGAASGDPAAGVSPRLLI
jgi:hypothetical protein